jgi:phosphopantothenate synthetase
MDALGESRFSTCVDNVITAVRHMNELKDAAHVAQQNDMKSIVESFGLGEAINRSF